MRADANLDQFRAAAAHAQKLLKQAAANPADWGGEVPTYVHNGVSPIHRSLSRWGRQMTTCEHLANWQPAGGLLALPNEVWCLRTCFPLVEKLSVKADPDRCDTCKETTVRFHRFLVAHGPVLISGNVCSSCARAWKAGRHA